MKELDLSKLTPLARASLISQLQSPEDVTLGKLQTQLTDVSDCLSSMSSKVESIHGSLGAGGSEAGGGGACSSSVSSLFSKIQQELSAMRLAQIDMESKLQLAIHEAASAKAQSQAKDTRIQKLQDQMDTWVHTAQQLMQVRPGPVRPQPSPASQSEGTPPPSC